MEWKSFFKLAILLCLFVLSNARDTKSSEHWTTWDPQVAKTMLEYSAAVYASDSKELQTWTCSRCTGLTKGFQCIEPIVDVQHWLQAFVGVAKDLDAIVIAFRGTKPISMRNWIADVAYFKLDLNLPGIPDAKVHGGFYYAYHNTSLQPCVTKAIEKAKETYGDLKIYVTGHSMGGALAALCGLDLAVNHGPEKIEVITFGQPRIGNAIFAKYYAEMVPKTVRVTNSDDIVPHLPPYMRHVPNTFHHFPREVWVRMEGIGPRARAVEKICDESGEDPDCSLSVKVQRSIKDHLLYFGVTVGCLDPALCNVVTDADTQFHGSQHLRHP